MTEILFKEHLNPTQMELVQHAINQSKLTNFHGLCLNMPMGAGKTRTMAIIGANIYRQYLIICSKTLIANWVAEFQKIFPVGAGTGGQHAPQPQYEIAHRDYIGKRIDNWKPGVNTRIVITTPEMVSRSYRNNNIESRFVTQEEGFHKTLHYNVPRRPLGSPHETGPEFLHGNMWEGIVIDEAHNYTNIKSVTCRAISSLCCKHRWLLTGTILQEPKIERVLGFFLLLNQTRLDCMPHCREWIHSREFPGFKSYSLSCEPPVIDTELAEHAEIYEMTRPERNCYMLFRDVIEKWNRYYQEERAVRPGNDPNLRLIRGHLMSLMTYLRLSLVSPRKGLNMLLEKIETEPVLARLSEKISYIKDLLEHQPTISSRLVRVRRIVQQHPDRRILVFGSFSSTLETTMDYLNTRTAPANGENRQFFLLNSKMSASQREQSLNGFRKSENGVLFMTYQIGSEGLNLQEASVVVYLDLFWNQGKQQQALARSYRTGQTAEKVDCYLIVSNTGFEKALLVKQREKLEIIRGLNEGDIGAMKVTGMSYMDMVDILRMEEIEEEIEAR